MKRLESKIGITLLLALATGCAHTGVHRGIVHDTDAPVLQAGQVDPSRSNPNQDLTPTQQRLESEFDTMERNYVITPYQPNYFLVTHNSQLDTDFYEAAVGPKGANLEENEMKFQVSAKLPVVRGLFSEKNDLYVGYTQTAWWQLFADKEDISAPFRETNYQPELFFRHFSGAQVLGGTLLGYDISLNHQSNGRSEPLSRSWNRLIGRAVIDYGEFALSVQTWWRLPEDDDEDDNPNEYKYLGYGDARLIWAPNKNTFTAMVRPGTEEAGFEATWSYPISNSLRIYTQWFNGYGESLIDYDHRTNRVGIGIAMTDFIMRRD